MAHGRPRRVKALSGHKSKFQVIAILWLLAFGCAGSLYFLKRGLDNLSEIARLASCRPFLIQRAAESYAVDNDGIYPPLSPDYGRFTYDIERVRRYAHGTADHICEFDRDGPSEQSLRDADRSLIDDWSYVYLGYVVESESQGLAFLNAYEKRVDAEETFESDLVVAPGDGNGGGDALNRLRTPSAFSGDLDHIQKNAAVIPVVIEWPGNHRSGSQVVFLDGHAEVIPYPGKFPMTERFMTRLKLVDAEFGPYRP